MTSWDAATALLGDHFFVPFLKAADSLSLLATSRSDSSSLRKAVSAHIDRVVPDRFSDADNEGLKYFVTLVRASLVASVRRGAAAEPWVAGLQDRLISVFYLVVGEQQRLLENAPGRIGKWEEECRKAPRVVEAKERCLDYIASALWWATRLAHCVHVSGDLVVYSPCRTERVANLVRCAHDLPEMTWYLDEYIACFSEVVHVEARWKWTTMLDLTYKINRSLTIGVDTNALDELLEIADKDAYAATVREWFEAIPDHRLGLTLRGATDVVERAEAKRSYWVEWLRPLMRLPCGKLASAEQWRVIGSERCERIIATLERHQADSSNFYETDIGRAVGAPREHMDKDVSMFMVEVKAEIGRTQRGDMKRKKRTERGSKRSRTARPLWRSDGIDVD